MAASIFTELYSKGALQCDNGLLLQLIPPTVKARDVSRNRETHHAGATQMLRKRQ